jgi:hypothetical protein
MTDIRETALASTPRQRPERVTAVVVALLVIGFSTWVLLTLPTRPPSS